MWRTLVTKSSILLSIPTLFLFLLPSSSHAAAPDNWTWTARNIGFSGSSAWEITVDPNDSNTLYVLLHSYGVYKSTDGGDNWTASNTGLPSGVAHDLEIDPNNSNTLYTIIAYTIYKSTDAGASWSKSHDGIRSWGTSNGIRFIEVDPTDSDILYAGTIVSGDNGGVWKSTDGGANWTMVASRDSGSGCDNDIGPFAIDPSNNQKIYAGSVYHGVYISTDGGSNWLTSSQTTRRIMSIIIDSDDNSKVYAAGSSGLYITTDGGSNWTLSGAISGNITDLAQSASNRDVMYAMVVSGTSYELYKSINRGSSWSNLNHSDDIVFRVIVDPANADILYLNSTTNGIYKSADGGTSTSQTNTGLPSIPSYATPIAIDSSGSFYTVTASGLFRSTDNGLNWQQLNSYTGQRVVAIDPSNTDIIYYTGNNILYKSTDGGENWSDIYTSGETFHFWLEIDPNNTDILFMTTYPNDYIIKSTDGGENWTVKETMGDNARRIRVDPNDSNRVYAVGYDYFWKSINNGETWTRITNGLPSILSRITLDSANNIIYATPAGTSATIYKSTDYGENWSTISTGIVSSNSFSQVVVDYSDSNVLYVNQTIPGYFYKSIDGGENWSAITTQGQPGGGYAYDAVQDPTDSTRLLVGHALSAGVYSYENHIPVFSSSTISVADENGGVVEAGDTLTYIVTVNNSGWADGNDINLRVDIPSGLTYVANSTKIDGTTVSPDPTSSPTINVSLGNESKDESIEVTFRATVDSDQGVGTTIGISGLITSDEDTEGTLSSTGYIIVGKFPTSSIGVPGVTCWQPSPLSPSALRGIPGPKADQVTLYWERPSSGEVTHYALAYGEKPGNYLYGATNIGSQTSFTVSGLRSCTDYYFTVAAVNDCASSPYSNEFKVKTNCPAVVSEIGEEETITEVEEEIEVEPSSAEVMEGEEGYTVKVKVTDEKNQPIQGAKVTLHSEPREEITNDQGTALFNNVEKGEHRIAIAYQNQQGEQKINLEGEVKEFDLTIQIKQTNPFLSTPVILVIGVLALSLGILSFLYFKKKS